jgi:hypothetical protein
MTVFSPITTPTPYDFEITQDKDGLWEAREKNGLIGGVFLTLHAAVRFALFEVNGDRSHVRVVSAARVRHSARRTAAGV